MVYRSGKVMLRVGDMLLDVHQGAACSFDQVRVRVRVRVRRPPR